jgi:exopolysaccharide biosynthesis polyprenyl glycosylphosphotransferase
VRRGWFIGLSVVLDMLFVNVGIVASFYLRFSGTLPDFNFEPYLALAPVITVIYLGCGYIYGLYEPERTEHPWAVMRAVVSSVTLGTALTSALLFFAGPGFFSFSRLVILISWFIVGLALTLWRLVFLRSTSIVWPEQRIVLVGTDELALELAAELAARERWGYRVAGLVSTEEHAGEPTGPALPFPLLGNVGDIGRIVSDERADRVIVVSPVALRELIEHLTLADEVDVRVDVVPELYEIFIGTVDSLVADIPLMEITRTGVPRWYSSAKRLVDVVGALFLLVLLLPVLILAAAAIMLTMGWPVLYSQDRTGRDMRTFRLHKFRTMVEGAERESGPVLASDDDPRITPLGKVLRTYRIDELPQLINVLTGRMSFVGPRPERPFFVERHARGIPGYRERFRIAPGITGLAQVSGGYATTAERKLKYDLIYMYHQNLLMDLQIIIETLRVVLTGRGAR